MIHWAHVAGPGRIGIMPRPRGGDWLADDLRRLRIEGAQRLVSLLEREEARDLELVREPCEAVAAGLTFAWLPIPDRSTPPDVRAFHRLVLALRSEVSAGAHVAIHCRAGIGRSSVLAATVLASLGHPVNEAFELLSACRGLPVPDTPEQRAWVQRFVENVLEA